MLCVVSFPNEIDVKNFLLVSKLNYMGMTVILNASDIGLLLIFVGFILTFIGFILLSRIGGKGGGILLIGPIPIIWGKDKESLKWVAIILSLVILIYLVFYVLWLIQL